MILSARALSMQLSHVLWLITPYHAECGVSVIYLIQGSHNLCKDK